MDDTAKYTEYKTSLIKDLEKIDNHPWVLIDCGLPNSPFPKELYTGELCGACRFIRRFEEGLVNCTKTHNGFVAAVAPFAKLEGTPNGLQFPVRIGNKELIHDEAKKRLVFKGAMDKEEKDELLKKSGDKQYEDAVKLLFEESADAYKKNFGEEIRNGVGGVYTMRCWVDVTQYIVCPITVDNKIRVWLLGQRLRKGIEAEHAATMVANEMGREIKSCSAWEQLRKSIEPYLTECFQEIINLDKEHDIKEILEECVAKIKDLTQVDFEYLGRQSDSNNGEFTVSGGLPLAVERAYFEDRKEKLLGDYKGKYVAIKGCEIICIRDTENEVIEEVYAKGARVRGRFTKGSDMGDVLIKKVAEREPKGFIFAVSKRTLS